MNDVAGTVSAHSLAQSAVAPDQATGPDGWPAIGLSGLSVYRLAAFSAGVLRHRRHAAGLPAQGAQRHRHSLHGTAGDAPSAGLPLAVGVNAIPGHTHRDVRRL